MRNAWSRRSRFTRPTGPLWELTHDDELWDVNFSDGQELTVVGTAVRVLHTPATRRARVRPESYSDSDLIKESIWAKLFALPDDTVVYTGHGDDTAIGEERRGF